MIMFVILYFGIMIDIGLFDLMVGKILSMVKGDLLKIVVGIVVFMMFVVLDGDGLIIYMIMISVMFLFYLLFGIWLIILVGIVGVGMGIMNMILWGGVILWVVSVLGVDLVEFIGLMIFVIVSGMFCMVVVVYVFGKVE